MLAVKVTALYAAFLAIFFIFLSFRVSMTRSKYNILVGDGGNFEMCKMMRAHANFSEYTPIFLILLLMLESMNLDKLGLNVLGSLFLIGRMLHYIGFSRYSATKKGKIDSANGMKYIVVGMFFNHTCIAVSALVILYKALS